MADYLENPPVPPKYIHWSEAPPKKKFGKREYNLIVKYWKQIHPKKAIEPFPAKKKKKKAVLTKKWSKRLEKAIKLKEGKK
jgi:hypothetical protein